MWHISHAICWHASHASTADLLLLNRATDNVHGVLRHDDIVILRLEHLLHRAGVLLRVLHEDLLLGLLVLTEEGRPARAGLLVVIKKNGLVLLKRNLGSVNENLLIREIGYGRGLGLGSCGSAHILTCTPGCFRRW